MYKKGDYQLTRYTKEERNEVREGFKRRVYQYLVDNDIDNDFNKDIVPTTTSGNFFYNNYSIKYFITLNRLILIKTAKNIVISINNNAFIYGLTSSTEPSSTEPNIARSNDKGKGATYLYNNNPPDLTVDINFLNCYFDDNRQDYGYLAVSFSFLFINIASVYISKQNLEEQSRKLSELRRPLKFHLFIYNQRKKEDESKNLLPYIAIAVPPG